MLVVILAVAVVVCAFNWLNRWVACAALAKYMFDKGYTPPSDEEVKACAMLVWKRWFKVK